jgi:predicted RNase H-like HicB family nuclease
MKMASVLKDPAVVEHVSKQVAAAQAKTRKAVLAEVKAAFGAHKETLGEDKAAVKAVTTFHKSLQDGLKTAAA